MPSWKVGALGRRRLLGISFAVPPLYFHSFCLGCKPSIPGGIFQGVLRPHPRHQVRSPQDTHQEPPLKMVPIFLCNSYILGRTYIATGFLRNHPGFFLRSDLSKKVPTSFFELKDLFNWFITDCFCNCILFYLFLSQTGLILVIICIVFVVHFFLLFVAGGNLLVPERSTFLPNIKEHTP